MYKDSCMITLLLLSLVLPDVVGKLWNCSPAFQICYLIKDTQTMLSVHLLPLEVNCSEEKRTKESRKKSKHCEMSRLADTFCTMWSNDSQSMARVNVFPLPVFGFSIGWEGGGTLVITLKMMPKYYRGAQNLLILSKYYRLIHLQMMIGIGVSKSLCKTSGIMDL